MAGLVGCVFLLDFRMFAGTCVCPQPDQVYLFLAPIRQHAVELQRWSFINIPRKKRKTKGNRNKKETYAQNLTLLGPSVPTLSEGILNDTLSTFGDLVHHLCGKKVEPPPFMFDPGVRGFSYRR